MWEYISGYRARGGRYGVGMYVAYAARGTGIRPQSGFGAHCNLWVMRILVVSSMFMVMSLFLVWAEQPATTSSTMPAELNLTLDEAIQLVLKHNRGLLNQHLNRETQRFSLEVAEDRYRPQFTISSSSRHDRDDETADVRFGADLRVPTGGTFGLG